MSPKRWPQKALPLRAHLLVALPAATGTGPGSLNEHEAPVERKVSWGRFPGVPAPPDSRDSILDQLSCIYTLGDCKCTSWHGHCHQEQEIHPAEPRIVNNKMLVVLRQGPEWFLP